MTADLKKLCAAADRVLRRCVADGDCWVYTGAIARGGYRFVKAFGKNHYAHRVVYEAMVAEIPAGLQLDHLCRNRSCVNPAHLEPVTPRVNTLRGESIQARNAAKTECVNGHPLTGSNVAPRPGGRRCRACSRERMRRRRLAMRAVA